MERVFYAELLIFAIATIVFLWILRQLRQDEERRKRGKMLSDTDIKIIRDCATEYGVREVVLFGSMLRDPQSAHDIDLGVLGIEPGRFFSFYGDLLMKLGKPVDLVDLSQPSKFTALVLKRGKKIYG